MSCPLEDCELLNPYYLSLTQNSISRISALKDHIKTATKIVSCTKKFDNVKKRKIHETLIISKDKPSIVFIDRMRIFQMFYNCFVDLFFNVKTISSLHIMNSYEIFETKMNTSQLPELKNSHSFNYLSNYCIYYVGTETWGLKVSSPY